MGPVFKGLIPTNPLSARNRGSLRDFPLRHCLGAVSVQLLPCHIPSLKQWGWNGPQCHTEGLGSCRSPNNSFCPTWTWFFREPCSSNVPDPCQDQSTAWRCYQGGKVLWWIWFLPHAFKLMGMDTARLHAWVHPMPCLCTLAPAFRVSPILTPPGRERWGLLSQLRAPWFSI